MDKNDTSLTKMTLSCSVTHADTKNEQGYKNPLQQKQFSHVTVQGYKYLLDFSGNGWHIQINDHGI